MNLQAENLIKKLKSKAGKEHYKLIDSSIGVLYCNGIIPSSVMRKCRDKLVVQITADITNQTKQEVEG